LKKGNNVTWEDYLDLVEQAAIDYDTMFKESKVSRSVHFANMNPYAEDNFVEEQMPMMDGPEYAEMSYDNHDTSNGDLEIYKAQ
jgi:hypothetical protein